MFKTAIKKNVEKNEDFTTNQQNKTMFDLDNNVIRLELNLFVRLTTQELRGNFFI